jgi:hypothetical protein
MTKTQVNPPTWHAVYPHGTKEGDEEMSFFYTLARSKWDWVSTAQIVKGSGLTRQRVEKIIAKYITCKPPLIFASLTKEDHWAYWERVPEMLKPVASIGDLDQGNRIKKHMDDPFASHIVFIVSCQTP